MTAAPETSSIPTARCVISGHLDTRTAAIEVADQLHDELGAPCDLAIMFASFHHRAAFHEAARTIRQTLEPGTLIGVTGESVLGNDHELEGLAGMSVMALSMPGVKLKPWIHTPENPLPISRPELLPEIIGLDDDFRAGLLVAEPFSTPMTRMLPALTTCGGDRPVPIVGGLASGASQPGRNVLVYNDRILSQGAIGLSLSGNIAVDCVVSQGCRPIGEPLVVTKARDNVLLELGGRQATEVLQDLAQGLTPAERTLLAKGLLIGTVINEYKPHFGRGDFLVRSILGYQKKVGGILVGDVPRIGQKIQFHVRDADTAAEDLQLLLDAQQLHDAPFAGLLFSCNGRGQRLFGGSNHDVGVIRERLDEIPLAGFFAAGEIGPVGSRSFVHGHTASLALLRTP